MIRLLFVMEYQLPVNENCVISNNEVTNKLNNIQDLEQKLEQIKNACNMSCQIINTCSKVIVFTSDAKQVVDQIKDRLYSMTMNELVIKNSLIEQIKLICCMIDNINNTCTQCIYKMRDGHRDQLFGKIESGLYSEVLIMLDKIKQ